MKTAWLVRGPQIAAKLSFWLSIAGYNRDDRSLNERIYRIYLVLFFTGWGFLAFSLISNTVHDAIAHLAGAEAVPHAAMSIAALGLLAWLAYTAWRVARQSPLTFSEDDQYLICLTPVRRSAVALAWLAGDWIFSVPFFWAGSVILAFTVLDGRMQGNLTLVELLPHYLVAGLRASIITLPLHFGLLALLYALGCLRLQSDRSLPYLSVAMRLSAILLPLTYTLILITSGFRAFSSPFDQAFLAPLTLPLGSALAIFPLLPGLFTAVLLAVGGALALWRASNQLNLSRAAQETVEKDILETVSLLGQTDLAEDIRRRKRLGVDHKPSLGGAGPGLRILPWKDHLQMRRDFHLRPVLHWLSIFGLAVYLLLTTNLIVQAFVLLLLADNLARLLTARLRADLSRWWLLRSLPFPLGSLLFYELALPGILATLLGWLAIAAAVHFGGIQPPPAILVPFLVLLTGFSGAADIARKSKTADLLNGSASPVTEGGVLIVFACLGSIALALTFVGSFLALSLAFAMTYYTGKYAASQMKKI